MKTMKRRMMTMRDCDCGSVCVLGGAQILSVSLREKVTCSPQWLPARSEHSLRSKAHYAAAS
jgi:hypothetical protein